MGLMDFLKPADINAGVEEFRATPGARLIDVRTAGEYAGGHIPGAVNVPLQQIGAIGDSDDAADYLPDAIVCVDTVGSIPQGWAQPAGGRRPQADGLHRRAQHRRHRQLARRRRTLGPSLGLRPPQERTATVTVKLRSWPKPRQASASQRK